MWLKSIILMTVMKYEWNCIMTDENKWEELYKKEEDILEKGEEEY